MDLQEQQMITYPLQAQGVITLRDRTFDTIEAIQKFIKSQPLVDRCELQVHVAHQLLEMKDQSATNLLTFYKWIEEDEAYKWAGMEKKEFEELVVDLAIEVETIKRSQSQIRTTSVNAVKELCKGERGAILLRYFELWSQSTERGYSEHYFQTWARLLRIAPSVRIAIEAVNWEIWERMQEGKRGKGGDPRVATADITKAIARVEKEKDLTPIEIPGGQMWGKSLRWGAVGLLEMNTAENIDIGERKLFADETMGGRETDQTVAEELGEAFLVLAAPADAPAPEPAPAPHAMDGVEMTDPGPSELEMKAFLALTYEERRQVMETMSQDALWATLNAVPKEREMMVLLGLSDEKKLAYLQRPRLPPDSSRLYGNVSGVSLPRTPERRPQRSFMWDSPASTIRVPTVPGTSANETAREGVAEPEIREANVPMSDVAGPEEPEQTREGEPAARVPEPERVVLTEAALLGPVEAQGSKIETPAPGTQAGIARAIAASEALAVQLAVENATAANEDLEMHNANSDSKLSILSHVNDPFAPNQWAPARTDAPPKVAFKFPKTTGQVRMPKVRRSGGGGGGSRQPRKKKKEPESEPEKEACPDCADYAVNNELDVLEWTNTSLMSALTVMTDGRKSDMPCLVHCREIGQGFGLKDLDKVGEYYRRFLQLYSRISPDYGIGDAFLDPALWEWFDPTNSAVRREREAGMNGTLKHHAAEVPREIEPLPPVPERYRSLEWFEDEQDDIQLSYVFEEELLMYVHHFHIDEGPEGSFIPVYYSIGQQIIRQVPSLHRTFLEGLDENDDQDGSAVIAIPTPLRIARTGYELKPEEIKLAEAGPFVMLARPGFVRVDAREEETEYGVEVAEIRSCHATCSVPDQDTSHYEEGKMELPCTGYVFPAIGVVKGLGDISDVLVGRSTWKMTGNDGFNEFWNEAELNCREWEKHARSAVVCAWEQQKVREMKAFGAESYYLERMNRIPEYESCYCRARLVAPAIAMAD
jgi:hypothetical protein